SINIALGDFPKCSRNANLALIKLANLTVSFSWIKYWFCKAVVSPKTALTIALIIFCLASAS
ncbi:3250_t:CDS:1, partial [Gigaspora rosea]